MSGIKNYIEQRNNNGEKVLTAFLTSGFPNKNDFPELALKAFDAGVDMLEIGFPFSDPLADGPVIQSSSKTALDNGVTLEKTFEYVAKIRKETDKPLILMGYANPVLRYDVKNFAASCKETGVNGVIIPDIPIEEFDGFFADDFNEIDKILLVTPTTPKERVKQIDEKSGGFVYCVSVSGTTGVRSASGNIEYVKEAKSLITKNKMLVGFGISNGESAKTYAQYSNGVIVGSAIIKSLMNGNGYGEALSLIKEIKQALV